MGDAPWVVLYTRTGCEKKVLDWLKKNLDPSQYTPFIPMKERAKIQKGGVVSVDLFLCFPGYVFIELTGGVERFFGEVYGRATLFDGAYYFLYYGTDKKNVVMADEEKAYIRRLMNGEYVIGASYGYTVGGRVKVIEGPMVGLEGAIVGIARNKRTATVAMPMMGTVLNVRLMFEDMKIMKKNEAV